MEDEYGRVSLINNDKIELPTHELVTGKKDEKKMFEKLKIIFKFSKIKMKYIGVVVAVVGKETEDGDFVVEVIINNINNKYIKLTKLI